MKKIKIIRVAIAVLIAAAVMTGCLDSEKAEIRHISSVLSVDCSEAWLKGKYDSHGGFLGDGISFYEFSFAEASPVAKIKDSGKWKPFPLSDNLTEIVWGIQTEDRNETPMLTRESDYEQPLFPKVENGYWFFLDRHSDATDRKDDTHVLDESRYSYNFTVAIYDSDNNMLYYSEFDT